MGEITAEPCLANIPFSSLTGARVAAELVGSHLEFQHEIPTLSLSLAMPGRVLDPESPNPRPLYSCHDFDRFHTSAVPAAISPNLWTPYTAMPTLAPTNEHCSDLPTPGASMGPITSGAGIFVRSSNVRGDLSSPIFRDLHPILFPLVSFVSMRI